MRMLGERRGRKNALIRKRGQRERERVKKETNVII